MRTTLGDSQLQNRPYVILLVEDFEFVGDSLTMFKYRFVGLDDHLYVVSIQAMDLIYLILRGVFL